jgi:hypothetical protein
VRLLPGDEIDEGFGCPGKQKAEEAQIVFTHP